MADSILDGLLQEFINHSAENGDLTHLTESMSVGFVVDADDPLQQGRLRVFCPAYNDDPKKLLHLPWCAYVSPMAGSIDNTAFARGSIEGDESSQGPIHYGFWSIPEIGAHVLVGCINGDARRRFWLGCFPQHQETHTIGSGKFSHKDGIVDGPLTSTGFPIQPQYSKFLEAFNNETNSSEWKTRGVEYQPTAVTEIPSPDKSLYVDDDLATIQENEQDEWVRSILGEHGYDWTGYKNLGAFLASKVHTWSTPGFHSITMDDRPFNCRIKIRTVGGNQIILDDTNERIYFSTSGGKSWLEMDAAGNIDLYAERRLSIHAEKDLNLSAGESIRMKATKFISMYAGDTRGQSPLTETLADGEIRIQSQDALHLIVEGNLFGDIRGLTNINFGDEVNIGVDSDLNIGTLGDINFSASDVTFTISGKGTTIDTLTQFLDTFVETFNDHAHVDSGPNLNPETPIEASDSVSVTVEPTEFSPWTNRVPQHEPWPRVLMQDSDDDINSENNGYLNNVDWIEQYDNLGQAGREPIGKVEGDDTLDRGRFWRR